MNIGIADIAQPLPAFGHADPRLAERQRTFAGVLGIDRRGPARTEPDRERSAAEQLVATTFIEPILRQAREVRSDEGPFGVTPAEKQFGGMVDAATAQAMVRSWDFPLVDRLARDMRAAMGKQEATP